jgi:hypothetical protein
MRRRKGMEIAVIEPRKSAIARRYIEKRIPCKTRN